MLSHVCQYEFPYFRPLFNVPPFDVGSFDSIGTFKGGRGGRATAFSIGFTDKTERGEQKVVATYVNHKGQPQLSEAVASRRNRQATLSVRLSDNQVNVTLSLEFEGRTRQLEFSLDLRKLPQQEWPIGFLLRLAIGQEIEKHNFPVKDEIVQDAYLGSLSLFRGAMKSVFSLAPVRTRPHRTYDETTSQFDPEGDHTFVFLARLSQEEDSAERERVFNALSKFGGMSTLFKKIKVKRLGNKPSDPFQILVALGGPPANLLDVGYGVSQALPVVVQSVLAERGGLLLLQEPEIHLHPRAQAALGTFFAHLVAKEGKELVVETHSDYLVDRVRREVAEGNIRAQDVLILFFERFRIKTRVHQILLDDAGNVVKAPKSYRQFFLEEEIGLLHRTGN